MYTAVVGGHAADFGVAAPAGGCGNLPRDLHDFKNPHENSPEFYDLLKLRFPAEAGDRERRDGCKFLLSWRNCEL